MRVVHAVLLIHIGACGGDNTAAPAATQPAPTTPHDGGASYAPDDPSSPLQDPSTNGRLVGKPKPRTARTIDIMLRSTPPGAGVYVGAEYMGETPTLWSGEPANGPIDFLFVLPHHAPARYKFIPITSGLVHARLEPLATPTDGGLGPLIAPTVAPDAAVSVDAAPPDPTPPAPLPAPPIDALPDAN